MVKTNAKSKPDSIPTKLGMPASSLSMKPPSTARTLHSNDKTTSKSINNLINQNEQVLQNQEDTVQVLTKLLDELRAQNATQQEVINKLILEKSMKTKSRTHINEREVSSHRSTTPHVELVGSKPIIEEVHSPKTMPPKSNYDMLLKEDKLLKFSYFDGNKNPDALLTWLRTFETYFKGKLVPDKNQIRFIVLHFTGEVNV